ncbi:metallophosphoesterase [Neobacillus sp. GCM10023253]|uniref:metallophosphoesterase n=1 Tax=Neobacillus sp. GCM10023253 TaxID=3252644 RepID=UPI003619C40F
MKARKRLVIIAMLAFLSFYFLPYMDNAQAAKPTKPPSNFTLTIMHVNDTHSHVEQYPMLTTAVNGLRKTYPNALLLHAGDVFYGTDYFTKYLGKADTWFMNNLKFDAMTLGNHEFDNGTYVLADFMRGLKFPVLSANVNVSGDPLLGPFSENTITTSPIGGKLYPAMIKDVNGEKVGIFGLLTTSYNYPIPVSNPTDKAKATVEALKSLGVNKIIALSHLGYSTDLSLANNVNGIDIIVGGHSHEKISPPVIVNKTEPTVIVQASYNLKYLGLLNVTFDANGVVKTADGKLLTVSNYAPDPAAQDILNQINSGTLQPIDSGTPLVKNGFITEGGNTYYYVDGVIQTEWQTISGNTYYFGPDGVMRKGWQTISGNTYYFGADTGIMKTGKYTIDGVTYNFGTDGVLITYEWVKDGDKTYLYKNGTMLTGWQTVDNKRYYLGDDGVMRTEWQTISGNTYYFGPDGVMRKGWQTISDKTYYFGADTGIMKTGWYTVDGVLYNFGSDGALITYKWVKDGDKTYLYANDVMLTGWQTYQKDRYYFGDDGVMRTEWQKISGNTYYFGPDGIMRKGWQAISGDTYYFGADSGIMKTGLYTINGVTYNFGTDGKLIQ